MENKVELLTLKAELLTLKSLALLLLNAKWNSQAEADKVNETLLEMTEFFKECQTK